MRTEEEQEGQVKEMKEGKERISRDRGGRRGHGNKIRRKGKYNDNREEDEQGKNV